MQYLLCYDYIDKSEIRRKHQKDTTRKGMSQGDFCRALNIDRWCVSAIENGKKNTTTQQPED